MRRLGFVFLAVVLSWEVHIFREATVMWAFDHLRYWRWGQAWHYLWYRLMTL